MTLSTEHEDWIRRLTSDNSGREQAIAELRSLLVRGLSKAFSTRYGGRISPEDIAQEAIVKILSSLETFEGRSRFSTWAMSIAIRIGISESRRRHYSDVSLDAMRTGDQLHVSLAAIDDPSPGLDLDRRKLVELLKQLIDANLTDKQREATQGLLNGLPVEEIARRTGSNRNAIYKLVHDARLRLKEGFAQAGVSPEDVNAVLA